MEEPTLQEGNKNNHDQAANYAVERWMTLTEYVQDLQQGLGDRWTPGNTFRPI